MGQCFSAQRTKDDPSIPSIASHSGSRKDGNEEGRESDDSLRGPGQDRSFGGEGRGEEDDWWDAQSNASFQSAVSHMALSEALEEWHDELDGNLEDIDDEAMQAARMGWHLTSPEIEEAAASVEGQRSPGKEMMVGVSMVREFKEQRWKDGEVESTYAVEKTFVRVETSGEAGFETPVSKAFVEDAMQQDIVANLVSQAQNCFEKSQIIKAYENMLKFCRAIGLQETYLRHGLAEHTNILGFQLDKLVAEYDATQRALHALKNDDGFMVSRDDSLRVLYKHEKGTTIHSLKFKATFDHPPEHILALAREWDLLPTWNKFCLDAIKLLEPSIFESYVYGAQWMMKPFKHMQSIVHARGIDLAEEHQCLLILINDVDAEDLPSGHAPLPKQVAKRKMVNVLPGSCIKLRPILGRQAESSASVETSDQRVAEGEVPWKTVGIAQTEAEFMVRMDPHIPMVPSILVNFVLGILAPYIYSQINKVLDGSFSDPNGLFPQRLVEQDDLYDYVRNRMLELLDSLDTQD